MEFNRSDWKLIVKDNQKDKSGNWYGQSVWQHIPTGKYAIKDMSGKYPHETEDGVLWIEGLKEYNQAVISVKSERDGRNYSTFVNGDFVKRLNELGILNLDIEAVHRLRSRGYAIVAFTPEEVHNENVRALEDRLIEVGNQILEQLQE